MPQISERNYCLQCLKYILLLYYTVPWVKQCFPYLPDFYAYVSSRRYWNSRKIVYTISRWSTSFINEIDDVRLRRDIRMDRATFLYVLGLIEDNSVFSSNQFNAPSQTDVGLQLQVFLYFLSTGGNGGSYHAIAQRFGIGEGSVLNNVTRVCEAILQLKTSFLYWPSQFERKIISKEIEMVSGFENVVGIIDGTHFLLSYKPQLYPEDYFTRKSQYAVSAQIVCDNRRRIRYIQVGYPGSVHDMRQFQNTDLFNKPDRFFNKSEYLLGDAAYQLSRNMIRPFKEPQASINSNKKFNYYLASVRISIEHTIGMLKGRFARLKDGFRNVVRSQLDNERINKLIIAASILHNICIAQNDTSACMSGDVCDADSNENYENQGIQIRDGNAIARLEEIKKKVLAYHNISNA